LDGCFELTLTFSPRAAHASVTFGVRKQLQAEQGIPELESKVEELQNLKKDLENTVISLRNQVEVRFLPVFSQRSLVLIAALRSCVQMIEKRETERRQLDEKKRKEEIEFLKHQGKHLDLFLKQMGGGK
jgi:dynein light intermediate chain, axonemal